MVSYVFSSDLDIMILGYSLTFNLTLVWDQGTFTPVGAKGGPQKTTFPSEFAMKFAPW